MQTKQSKVQRLYDALRRIADFQTSERLRKVSLSQYGLEFSESIEMAYDNVIGEAKSAIKGMRRPE
jgi:hypothetical protein